MKKIKNILIALLPIIIISGVISICVIMIVSGVKSEDGSITLDGSNANIEEYTSKFIENSNKALARIMEVDRPTDEETIRNNSEPAGKGYSASIEGILSRVLPDGHNDGGLGFQCSRYTAYLGTGQWSYSSYHPDYGPVNGKDLAEWLVNNYGYKYIDNPIKGAIGSGGFNTIYGHTALYLYATGEHTAMVNDANYTPLAVSTHNMNIDGWVWVVPDDYEPEPEIDDIPLSPDTGAI